MCSEYEYQALAFLFFSSVTYGIDTQINQQERKDVHKQSKRDIKCRKVKPHKGSLGLETVESASSSELLRLFVKHCALQASLVLLLSMSWRKVYCAVLWGYVKCTHRHPLHKLCLSWINRVLWIFNFVFEKKSSAFWIWVDVSRFAHIFRRLMYATLPGPKCAVLVICAYDAFALLWSANCHFYTMIFC